MWPLGDVAERLCADRLAASTRASTARPSARRSPRSGSPARSRTIECRPSAPTTRSARISCGPPGVVRDDAGDAIRSPRSGRSTSACHPQIERRKARACSARKSRKSHCGISAMNLQWRREVRKSAIVTVSPATWPRSSRTSVCGRFRNSSSDAELVASLRAWTDGWCRRENRAGSRRASRARPSARRRAPAEIRASSRRDRRRRSTHCVLIRP